MPLTRARRRDLVPPCLSTVLAEQLALASRDIDALLERLRSAVLLRM